MRQRNWRFVSVGVAMVVLAVAFFLGMQTIAPRSNDPAAMMQTVGRPPASPRPSALSWRSSA
jgi:hypothetical protein